MKLSVIKFCLVISLTLFVNELAISCSCLRISTFLKTAEYNKFVVKGRVLKHETLNNDNLEMVSNFVFFEVTKSLKGSLLTGDTIRIAESNGFECYSTNFIINENYYVSGEYKMLQIIEDNIRLKNLGEILMPGACSESSLKIRDEGVCGKITIRRRKLTNWYFELIGRLKKTELNGILRYQECLKNSELETKILKLKK